MPGALGDGEKFFLQEYTSVKDVGCGIAVFGDPARGNARHCAYRAVPDAVEKGWLHCAKENATCQPPDGNARVVRFGSGSSWDVLYASGPFPCTSQLLLDDPSPGNAKVFRSRATTDRLQTGILIGFSPES